jgi:excisionase family DNA binding protein
MFTLSPNEPLLSLAEVAKRLAVTEKTVRRMIADGELPALRVGHGRGVLRVDPDELAAWLYAPTRSQR